jgi:D-glycero-alpha-D-manno-heptose 1-phosphate guanylyltransferase
MERRVREAIVLAGGFGTRLAHVVPDVCKPMAPVAGRPFLRFLMDQLAEAGFERVILADGYRREQIEKFFGAFYRGMDVLYSSEDDPLFTGGAVKKALTKCEGDWAFVLNGDTWLDVDFTAMEAVGLYSGGETDAVLAVKPMCDFDRYGTIEVSDEGVIEAFNEKQPCDTGLINAGVYLVRADALVEMPDKFSLEKDFFSKNVGDHRLRACRCEGGFIDIGVPEDYERAQVLMAPFARRWKLAMFDRDGTINIDTGHLHEPNKIKLIPSTIRIMQRYMQDSGYKIVVVTNQAGIAKGLYGVNEMRETHRAMQRMLEAFGVHVDAWYYCPHHPDVTGPCECRKPAPGMLLGAMRDFDADPRECIMYGDKDTDRAAAEAAAVRFVQV